MTTYTIKPLVWERCGMTGYRDESAKYIVADFQDGEFQYLVKADKNWSPCDSLAHGKQLCQQHWESEAGIGKFLERVE